MIISSFVTFLIVSLVVSIFYAPQIREWRDSKSKDDRSVINLSRDKTYSLSDWMNMQNTDKITRGVTQDVNIDIEYKSTYSVTEGITFSFSVEDEGFNSTSKEKIKNLRADIYLIKENDKKIISKLIWDTYRDTFSYYDPEEEKYCDLESEKFLGGDYRYHLDLKDSDIGEWRIIILCKETERTPSNYSSKKIEWEEKYFEVSMSKRSILPKKEMSILFIGLFISLLTIMYGLYPRLELFFRERRELVLNVLIFYFMAAIFLGVFLFIISLIF